MAKNKLTKVYDSAEALRATVARLAEVPIERVNVEVYIHGSEPMYDLAVKQDWELSPAKYRLGWRYKGTYTSGTCVTVYSPYTEQNLP